MAQANIEQFVQLVAQDVALQEQLKSSTSMQDFQTRMVDLGKQKGLIFSEEDVATYTKSQVAQITGRNPDEKLTEAELETVAGGTTPVCITATITITGDIATLTIALTNRP